MRLLVTGATGFVGSVLLGLLPEALEYDRLTLFVQPGDPGLSRLPESSRPPGSGGIPGRGGPAASGRARGRKDVQVVYGDITSPEEVRKAVQGHSHVIHLAGFISYWPRERERLLAVNHHGVRNLVDACLEHGIQRLVHVSTVGAVGFYRDGSLADEDTPYNWPRGFHYMGTKLAGQRVVEQAVRERGLPAIILNPASLMGPGDPDPLSAHNQLYRRIYRGALFGSFAGGLAVTDVRDLCRILIKALSLGTPGEKYLIVGANVEYAEVITAIGRCFDARVYPLRLPAALLTLAGWALERLAALSGQRPLLTTSYGRLSGWHTYYSNRKSVAAFAHEYLPFERTVAEGCEYYRKTHA